MNKMIQIRDVPENLHRILKARATREGSSLSDYIKNELARSAERPTMREWMDLVSRSKPIPSTRSATEILREIRDAQ